MKVTGFLNNEYEEYRNKMREKFETEDKIKKNIYSILTPIKK